jgi:pyrroline-5-carboxylate reductase
MQNNKFLFLGAGKMATAIAGGMVNNGFEAHDIKAFDISEEATEAFTLKTGVRSETENCDKLIKDADIIILAVKPQYLTHALSGKSLSSKLIISIAAGAKLQKLHDLTKAERIIRVMPNTPALAGAGMAAYCASEKATPADVEITEKVLEATGEYCRVPENLLDAVTGVSGSGPAYVFDFIQALADGGVNAGLPREIALKLAAQTVYGSAKLVIDSGLHPAVLRDQVTSPAGTTAKALAALENGAFRGTVIEAVLAATERSIELGSD